MKKIVILILMALVVNAVAFAQNYQEVVYLKNGSVIRGVIVEQIPSVSLKIQTADGSIFAYQMDEVEKITKELAVDSHNLGKHSQKSNQYKLRTGYRGFIEAGYSVGVGDYGRSRAEFSTSHGYQILPSLFAGIGFGVYHRVGNDWFPIFADIRGTLPCRSVCQPLIDFKVGYSVGSYEGFYMNPSIGCRFAVGGNCGINIGVGYEMQKRQSRYGIQNDGAVTFKVGFDF